VIVAGFDEAGYGPRLGPLVVGWTAFEVPDRLMRKREVPDLWDLLEGAVRRGCRGDPNQVWVADSKEIKPKKDGHKHLELGVLGFMGTREPLPTTLEELVERVGQPASDCGGVRWFESQRAFRVPAHAWPGEVSARSQRLAAIGERTGVQFAGSQARVLPAEHLNGRFDSAGNKAEVLGEVFVDLLRCLREQHGGPLHVTCDKQGGRAAYAGLLGRAFPRCPIEIDVEGQLMSSYRVKTRRGVVRITFRAKADSTSLPVALASMTCKYLRELFMDLLNAWFQARVPGLRPTAGYAKDAGRFLKDVGAALPGMGVPMNTLVRAR
jgi:hypothetical protein